jgi:hypothetical protein
MVWPACNLRPSSMLLAFCKSSTVTLYIFAMDVSVSPRATVCVLPSTTECDADAPAAAAVGGAGAASPTITPGRACESSCSSLRISCESASILTFCSSIFFAKASSCADSANFPSCGAGVSAKAVQSAKELTAQRTPITFISAKFCHRDIYLTSGFAALTIVFAIVKESTALVQ